MRILQLSTSTTGGAGIAALNAHEALIKSGIDSTLVTLSPTDIFELETARVRTLNRSLLYRIRSKTLTFLQYWVIQKGPHLQTPLSLGINPELLSVGSYDVIHIHAMYNFLNTESLNALLKSKKSVFLTLHDQRFVSGGCHGSLECKNFKSRCQKCPQVRSPFQVLVTRSFQKMKSLLESSSNKPVLVTPSMWLKQISSEVFPGIKSVLLPNCIGDEFFNQEKNSADLTEKIRIQKVGFISLDLNNPYKGLDIFLKALNKLDPMVKKDLSVILIGDGRVNDLPTDVNFVFLGKLLGHQRVEAMSVLDLVVIPSKQDNMPNVMCEALSLGIPVIGARVGGIPEILDQFGMPIFDSGDDQTLSEILEKALVNGLPRADRNRAFELFSSESYAKNVLSIYISN